MPTGFFINILERENCLIMDARMMFYISTILPSALMNGK